MTGKLHLTFHATYLPKDEGPVPGNGKLKVKLHDNDSEFTLEDTALEWLVVTKDHKAVLKGTGKVGETDGYGFVAYGDGDRDGFRLVAWPLAEGAIPLSRPRTTTPRRATTTSTASSTSRSPVPCRCTTSKEEV